MTSTTQNFTILPHDDNLPPTYAEATNNTNVTNKKFPELFLKKIYKLFKYKYVIVALSKDKLHETLISTHNNLKKTFNHTLSNKMMTKIITTAPNKVSGSIINNTSIDQLVKLFINSSDKDCSKIINDISIAKKEELVKKLIVILKHYYDKATMISPAKFIELINIASDKDAEKIINIFLEGELFGKLIDKADYTQIFDIIAKTPDSRFLEIINHTNKQELVKKLIVILKYDYDKATIISPKKFIELINIASDKDAEKIINTFLKNELFGKLIDKADCTKILDIISKIPDSKFSEIIDHTQKEELIKKVVEGLRYDSNKKATMISPANFANLINIASNEDCNKIINSISKAITNEKLSGIIDIISNKNLLQSSQSDYNKNSGYSSGNDSGFESDYEDSDTESLGETSFIYRIPVTEL